VLADMANRHKVSENSVAALTDIRTASRGPCGGKLSKRCSGTVPLTPKFMVIVL
jgi:hypothetical protein